MRKKSTFLIFVFTIFYLWFTELSFAQVIYSEDFESGAVNQNWATYYANEDNIVVKPMTDAPQVLTDGGNYVGWLQDVDASFTGSAVAINGDPSLTDYSIEADVYCYVGQTSSAYTGLVVYADTVKNDFYKLRVDFDASNRINFSGRRSDPNTFLPLFSKDFKGADNPGLFPTTDGWHKMKIEVRNTSPNETSFWCYFDGVLLAGCPVTDTNSNRVTSGSFGLYTFQMDSDGIPGFFDNIVVNKLDPITSVKNDFTPIIPKSVNLSQNYPNPFNPETNIFYNVVKEGFVSLTIHDMLGRTVKTLVYENQRVGQYSVVWDGKDDSGNMMSSGVYLYTLTNNSFIESKKMVLLK